MNGEILFSCKFKVGKHGSKKNNKRIFKNRATGQQFIGSESKTKFLEHQLVNSLIRERIKKVIGFNLIDCDINAQFIFSFPKSVYFTKKMTRSNKVGDISNLYQSVEDALQKAQVIRNDSQIESHDGSRRVPIDGNEYFLEIILRKVITIETV